MNTEFSTDFGALTSIEEDFLSAKLQSLRMSISHSGEKGRSLESIVSNFLRDILPSEYGISTGFVAYHASEGEIKLSPQLDIIIYDAIRCGPIVRLSTCEVFPLEAVYAYVEVKASIQSTSDKAKEFADNSIERCLDKNKIISLLPAKSCAKYTRNRILGNKNPFPK